MRRLSQAGFKKEFVRPAILPDWWEPSCATDPALLEDIEIRVARFLGLPLATVKDVSADLKRPAYPTAQLRRVRNVDRDRLGPAIHAAMRIAAAVVRCLNSSVSVPRLPPAEGLPWRQEISRSGPAVSLDDILGDLWHRGIPVVPVDILPVPSFQGLACIVENRPVIVVGHKHDEPGRAAFLLAHEAGHIGAGDCAPDQPVVDEEDEISDESEMERRADQFAMQVLVGAARPPSLEAQTFKQLANAAAELESSTGADASVLIFAWAAQTRDYPKASMAVKALYRARGARKKLRHAFEQHVDLDAASESDRALLRCVHGQAERDEAPH